MASAPTTPAADAGEMKRTLSLTGLTINAMALIAPGAFLWTTFQSQSLQAVAGQTTAMDMLPGLLFALLLAFLTALSYSELANLYTNAGAGSSYYFAEAAFLEREEAFHYKFARLAKFVVGWVSHLYYWIYPGIMVAFTGVLVVYIVGLGISHGLLMPRVKKLIALMREVVGGSPTAAADATKLEPQIGGISMALNLVLVVVLVLMIWKPGV